MSAILFQSLSLILSVLGTVAVIILALKLLTKSQTKLTLSVKARVRRANGMQFNPMAAAVSGFINAATTGNTLRATATMFSGMHAKMVSKESARFMLLGIAQSHIIIVAIAWAIVWIAPPISVAVAIAGVGLVIAPLFRNEEKKAVPKILISTGVLILGVNYFTVFANGCITLLNINMLETQQFLNYGAYSVLMGAMMGVMMVVAIKHIDAVLIIILALSTAPIAPINMFFGAMIGSALGGIFFVVPVAENEGSVAKKIIIRHTISVAVAIIISAMSMTYVIDLIIKMGGTKVALPIAYVIHTLVVMWIATWIVKPIVDIIDKHIPDSDKREMRLKVLSTRIRPDSTISLILAHNETINHIRRTYKMLSFVRDMLNSEGDEKYVDEMNNRVNKYNEITKRVESEVLSYVCAIALDDLSKINTVQMQRVIVAMNTVAQIAAEVCELSNLVNQGINNEIPLNIKQKITLRNIVVKLQAFVYEAVTLKNKNPSDIKMQDYHDMSLQIKKEMEPLTHNKYENNQVLMIEIVCQMKKINKLITRLVPQPKNS